MFCWDYPRFRYDGNGNLIRLINALRQKTGYKYDGADRLIAVADTGGHTARLERDAKGRLQKLVNPLQETLELRYDPDDKLTGVFDALNKRIQNIEYDARDNVRGITDALGRGDSFEYDELSRLHKLTDALERPVTFGYDDLDRLVSSLDALGGESGQEFDADGNRTQLADPDQNAAGFDHDKRGRLIKASTAGGGTRSRAYDDRGLLSDSQNGRGQSRRHEYDAAGRLTGFTDPDGALGYTLDANGNLREVRNSADNSRISRTYDKLSRVTSYTDSRGNMLGYEYDAAGNLKTLVYPDGRKVRYEYDAARRLRKVTDWAQRQTVYQYDPNGRPVLTARPNGTSASRVYDAAGQLLQHRELDAQGGLIVQYDYSYNAAGEIIREQITPEPLPWAMNLPLSMTYTDFNRLETWRDETVAFDMDGNMIRGPLNGALADFVFDSRNRLIQAGDAQYAYDAENHRIGVTENGETAAYVINPEAALSQVLIKTAPDGTRTYYVYGLGLIGEQTGGEYTAYHFDLRGSTVALSDEAGQVTQRFEYSPFGILTGGDASRTPFLYVGRYGVMTDANGLYYMRARYYNPDIRRFVNQDILIGSVVDGQTLNRFGYVNGNPGLLIDPTGLYGGYYGSSYGAGSWWNFVDLPIPHIDNRLSAASYEQLVEYAWAACRVGCYDESAKDNPFIKQYDNQFVQTDERIGMIIINTLQWDEVYTSHGKAYESPGYIPNTNYKLKYYIDPERGKIMAIVTPTSSLVHYLQWPIFIWGYPVNAGNALNMMNSLPRCPKPNR